VAVIQPNDVQSRADLVAFIAELAVHAREDSYRLPNASLSAFFDGLSGWMNDMDGYFANRGEVTPPEPSWRLIAQALAAGLVYE
jgi:hypothetical protein